MPENFDSALRRELENIFDPDKFQRSPRLSVLLEFLADRSTEPNSAKITQYDISTQAIGRGENFAESSESSFRVQISRLRKSLANYYRLHAPGAGVRVYLKPGEYRLAVESLAMAYPELVGRVGSDRSYIGLTDETPREASRVPVDRASSAFKDFRSREAFGLGALAALAIMVETHGFFVVNASKVEAEMRLSQIIEANREPHALLEAYIIPNMMAFGRGDMLKSLPERPAAFDTQQPSVEFAEKLRRSALGQDSQVPEYLRARVWSDKTRNAID